ncbi:unnamed protein product [Nesidiocoris tenuis]|uniref:PHD-type domain-containing protein n=1 Tax=Nesidiocoris tenuis TaxID=355587 RepID=A0A6H5H029_9HEMI|nr:unnamed protein product [Nesidiocoris tenuis]
MTRTKTAQKKKGDSCSVCKANVTNNDKAVLCDGKCHLWFHISCIGLSEKTYQELQEEDKWFCKTCEPGPPRTNNSSSIDFDDQHPAITKIGSTLNQITSSLSELQRSVVYQSSQYDQFYQEMKNMQAENTRISNDMTTVKESVRKLNTDGEYLKKRINHLEQVILSNELEIQGIPGNNSDKDIDIFVKICEHIKVKFDERDITSIRRIKPTRQKMGHSTIIVAFRDSVVRQKILESKKTTPSLMLKDIGIDSPGKLFLNERLTPANRQLYWLARQTKTLGFKFCWIKNGNIFIRKNENTPLIKITDEKDIPTSADDTQVLQPDDAKLQVRSPIKSINTRIFHGHTNFSPIGLDKTPGPPDRLPGNRTTPRTTTTPATRRWADDTSKSPY